MESCKLYPAAKFVPVGSTRREDPGTRNCLPWIIAVVVVTLILSFSSSILYCLKQYTRVSYTPDNHVYNKSAAFPKIWTSTNYNCRESHRLQAIPGNLLDQLNDSDVHDSMNKALLLHVEGLVKNHNPQQLKTIFNDYHRELSSVEKFEDFVIFLRNLNSNRVRFCLTFLTINAPLSDFNSFVDVVEELSTWYDYLHDLGGFLSAYEVQKSREFYVNVTDVNFYKFTTETQAKASGFAYTFSLTKKKILEINDVIREWLSPVEVETRNGSFTFSGKVVVLSEAVKKVFGDVHTVKVLCGVVLYLDVDVKLPGVNLGMIAPKWVFVRKVKINLDGSDGEVHQDDAKDAGKPGNPGGNGGDFLGVGDMDEDYLVVSTNGGRGGPGQNGGKGHDGADHTRPDPPLQKPTCIRLINTFRNRLDQRLTRYKVYGANGCGESGSDGGVGGLGGKSGVVTLVNKNIKVTKGADGKGGSPGKGGGGGSGGKDGCFYEVLDVNDDVIHRATKVKCVLGNNLPSGNPGKDNWNRRGITVPTTKVHLSICDCIVDYIEKIDLSPDFISTLMKPNSAECIMRQYNAYKAHDCIEIYKNLINSRFEFLNPILLARVSILKDNVDFLPVDFDEYLDVIESSMKNTNEQTRQLQPIVYLRQKMAGKVDKLNQMLKSLKSRLLNLDESESEDDEKLRCVMLTTIDVMHSLVRKPTVEKIHSLDVFLGRCVAPSMYIDTDAKVIPARSGKFRVLKIGDGDVHWYLEKLRGGLDYLKDYLNLITEKRKLLEELVSEVEHLSLLCKFAEWEESVRSIFRSLNKTKVKVVEDELSEGLIMLQYKLAEDAARQKGYPFLEKNTRPRTGNRTTLVGFLDRLEVLRQSPRTDNCRNELEAYFGKNSAVGEFYFWPNVDIRAELEALFSGREIRLESNLINRHSIDKNFIRFKSIKLEPDTRDERRDKLLRNILLDYKMAMTHSGYSHYNWMGETRVVVSEEVTFEYSFKALENGEPEVWNVLYKKAQNGDIALSPYTTWTIRLTPINEKADYRDLKPYKDLVNLRLTGTGTFIP